MLRFIMSLFGKKYEPCAHCALLREQLEYERDNNKEMLLTLTSLLKPQVVQAPETAELQPVRTNRFTRWSHKKAELERLEREKVRVNTTSPVVAHPDNDKSDIAKLEEELGVQ
jgi:hypothetical protein